MFVGVGGLSECQKGLHSSWPQPFAFPLMRGTAHACIIKSRDVYILDRRQDTKAEAQAAEAGRTAEATRHEEERTELERSVAEVKTAMEDAAAEHALALKAAQEGAEKEAAEAQRLVEEAERAAEQAERMVEQSLICYRVLFCMRHGPDALSAFCRLKLTNLTDGCVGANFAGGRVAGVPDERDGGPPGGGSAAVRGRGEGGAADGAAPDGARGAHSGRQPRAPGAARQAAGAGMPGQGMLQQEFEHLHVLICRGKWRPSARHLNRSWLA